MVKEKYVRNVPSSIARKEKRPLGTVKNMIYFEIEVDCVSQVYNVAIWSSNLGLFCPAHVRKCHFIKESGKITLCTATAKAVTSHCFIILPR